MSDSFMLDAVAHYAEDVLNNPTVHVNGELDEITTGLATRAIELVEDAKYAIRKAKAVEKGLVASVRRLRNARHSENSND